MSLLDTLNNLGGKAIDGFFSAEAATGSKESFMEDYLYMQEQQARISERRVKTDTSVPLQVPRWVWMAGGGLALLTAGVLVYRAVGK